MADKTAAPTTDDLMRELPGIYDHDRVIAYERCVIDLAEHGGVNLLEMMYALRDVLLAVETQLAKKASALRVPDGMRASSENPLESAAKSAAGAE